MALCAWCGTGVVAQTVPLPMAAPALASVSAAVTGSDPLDPRAPITAQTYRSVLSRLAPSGEWRLCDWKQANDQVARVGGWRTYLREGPEAVPPAAMRCAPP